MNNQKILNYFKENIFQAESAYNGWKIIKLSKSKSILPELMADKYTHIQKNYSSFFIQIERALLINFTITILHCFDKQQESYSLIKVSE